LPPVTFPILPLHPPDDASYVPFRTDIVTTSQLASYLHCPQQYHLMMNDGVPWDFIPSAKLIQETVHASISKYYQSLKAGKVMDAVALLESYGQTWDGMTSGLPLEPETDPEDLKRVGQALLETFAEELHSGKVIEVGENVQAPLMNFETGESLGELSEVLEVVEVDEVGSLTVRHISVSDKYTDLDDLELRLALMGCSYLVRSAWDLKDGPIKLQCDQLVYSPTPQVYSQQVISKLGDESEYTRTAGDILKSIDEGIFTPKPGVGCLTCPVEVELFVIVKEEHGWVEKFALRLLWFSWRSSSG